MSECSFNYDNTRGFQLDAEQMRALRAGVDRGEALIRAGRVRTLGQEMSSYGQGPVVKIPGPSNSYNLSRPVPLEVTYAYPGERERVGGNPMNPSSLAGNHHVGDGDEVNARLHNNSLQDLAAYAKDIPKHLGRGFVDGRGYGFDSAESADAMFKGTVDLRKSHWGVAQFQHKQGAVDKARLHGWLDGKVGTVLFYGIDNHGRPLLKPYIGTGKDAVDASALMIAGGSLAMVGKNAPGNPEIVKMYQELTRSNLDQDKQTSSGGVYVRVPHYKPGDDPGVRKAISGRESVTRSGWTSVRNMMRRGIDDPLYVAYQERMQNPGGFVREHARWGPNHTPMIPTGIQLNDAGGLNPTPYNHFTKMVDEAYATKNIQYLVPSQMAPETRKMYRDSGVKRPESTGGALTAAYTAYAMRPGFGRISKIASDMKLLQGIQNDWFESKTWGEDWNQLGSRGILSSTAINWVQQATSFIMTKEQAQARFEGYYRPKPVYQNTQAADFARGVIDYFEDMTMNMAGFYFFTTAYALLSNTVCVGTARSIDALVSGGTVGETAWKWAKAGWSGARAGTRFLAADVARGLVSRVAHSLDVLTGAGGKGSWQGAIDFQARDLVDVHGVSHARASSLAMRRGNTFVRNNVLMRMSGASLVGEFYANLHYGVSTFLRNPSMKNTRLLWEPLVYEFSTAGKSGVRDVHGGGGKLSLIKFGSSLLFGAVFLDRITGYLGEHIGGIDAARVDRANAILRDAAESVGMHPVQLQRTANVARTDNPWLAAYRNFAELPARGMINLGRDFVDQVLTGRMRDVLGPNIIHQGQEMDAAQKAALRGDTELASIYMLMAHEGRQLYQNNLFKADLWRSWVVQASPNPLMFTFTMSMSEHRATDGRSIFSHQQQQVREFMITLQGPVMVTVGWSVDLPIRMMRELGTEDQRTLQYKAWTTYFKEGSIYGQAMAMGILKDTFGMLWHGTKTLTAFTLERGLYHSLLRKEKWGAAGVTEAVVERIRQSLSPDHDYMANLRGGLMTGRISKMQVRIGAMKAAGRILMLPYTLPLELTRLGANVGFGAVEQLKWQAAWKLNKGVFTTLDGTTLNKVGRVLQDHLGERMFFSSHHRTMIREVLLARKDLGMGSVDDFAKVLGHEAPFGELNASTQADVRRKFFIARRVLMSELRIPTINELANPYYNKASLGKWIYRAGKLGILAAGLTAVGLAVEAGQNASTDGYIQANVAYRAAMQLSAWSASQTAKVRMKLNNPGAQPPMYQLAGRINEDTAIAPLRGILGLVKATMIFWSTPLENVGALAGAVISEGLLLPAAGWDPSEDMEYNPFSGVWSPKVGASAQRAGLLPFLSNVVKNTIKAFFRSFYHPMGTRPYRMVGPVGATQQRVDKDRQDWAGWFAQFGPLMFLQTGYAEQFVFRTGWEKRRYQEWKYMRQAAYEPMGLRQLMRDRAIRTGQMYHGDIASQATSWGMQLELMRRSHLFQWARSVDPYDYAFVPGVLTHGKGKDSNRIFINRYKDPKNQNEAAFLQVLKGYLADFQVKDKPGQLGEAEEELQMLAAVQQNRDYSDYLQRPYSKTPQGFQMNVFQNATFRFVAGASLGMVGLSLLGWAADKGATKGLGSVGQLVQSFRERAAFIATQADAKTMKKLRQLTPRARMVQLDVPDGYNVLRIGLNDGKIYTKGNGAIGRAISDSVGGKVDYSHVFWTDDELKSGGIRGFYSALNRAHGVDNTFRKVLASKHATLNQLASVKNAIATMRQFTTEINPLNWSMAADVKDVVKGLEGSLSEIDTILRGAIDELHTSKDWFGTLDLEKILSSDGKKSALHALPEMQGKLSGLMDDLVKTMEKYGVIEYQGPTKSNALRDVFRKLGVSNPTLDRIGDLEYIKRQMEGMGMDHLSKGTASVAEQPFVREMRQRFNKQFVTDVVRELSKEGESGAEFMKDFLRSVAKKAGGKVDESILGKAVDMATDPSVKITFDDQGDFMKLFRAIASDRRLGDADLRTQAEAKLQRLRSKAQVLAFGDTLKSFMAEGTSYRVPKLGWTVKIPAPSTLIGAGLTKTVMGAYFVGVPMLDEAYYSEIAHESQNRGASADWAAVQAYNARTDWVSNAVGFEVSAAVSSGTKAAASWLTGVLTGGGALLGGVPGTVLGFLLLVGIDALVLTGVSAITRWFRDQASAAEKASKGMTYFEADRGFLGQLTQYNWKLLNGMNERMIKKGRKLEIDLTSGNKKLGVWDSALNWAINGVWDPRTLSTPGGGILRKLFDRIFVHQGETAGTQIPWQRAGGSVSLLFPGQLQHSVIWVGNDYDLGTIMVSQQNTKVFQGAEAFRRDLFHPSVFGMLIPTAQVGANKDGIDPLGPSWMRDDYRTIMFRPPNLVQSEGMQAELLRRADLEMMISTNLADGRIQMGHVIRTYPIFDPRSGAGMPPDAFLASVIDPTQFALGFVQPRGEYHHPVLSKYDPALGRSFVSTLHGKVVKPIKLDGKSPTRGKANPKLSLAQPHKQDVVVRAAAVAIQKMVAKKLQEKSEKKPERKTILAVVPAAGLAPRETSSDTCRTKPRTAAGATREISVTPAGGVVLPAYKKQEPGELAVHQQTDSCRVGSNSNVDTL